MHCRECGAKSLCHSKRLLKMQSKHVIASLSEQKFEGLSHTHFTSWVKHDVLRRCHAAPSVEVKAQALNFAVPSRSARCHDFARRGRVTANFAPTAGMPL